jgi:hypothetical protein
MLFVPGEVPSELVVGLPSDFNTTPETVQSLARHEMHLSATSKNR